MGRTHTIRIPVHGFIEINDWERDIINHWVFQRLRRIRQLAFSEHVYPGSTHSRFEHSLGVMHLATRMFDKLTNKYETLLADRLGQNPAEGNAKALVRLAALLHDVGHAPFSHTSEDLMPLDKKKRRYVHEDYSAALIRHEMTDVIDSHPINKQGCNITGAHIADFYSGQAAIGPQRLFWRELVNGQLDADRMDYLLRDAYHCGVTYGSFDLDRIIDTLVLVENELPDSVGGLSVGVEQGGRHAAEGMILARYFMFQQVYFHPVRKAYDYHAGECVGLKLKATEGNGHLPDPSTPRGRKQFLALDDWTVMEFIKQTGCERHGDAILHHAHDRCVHKTPELPKKSDIDQHKSVLQALKEAKVDAWVVNADKEWYKIDKSEVRVADTKEGPLVVSKSHPLSKESNIVQKIEEGKKLLIFVPKANVNQAKRIVDG